MKKRKICIIGGGVIGCALAYQLSKDSKNSVIVLEKNETIPGVNQSSRNAGVIHAGIYYSQKDEPLRAKLCLRGNTLLYQFCNTYNVPYKNCGKLLIATTAQEETYLKYIFTLAQENQVPDIQFITQSEIKKKEPWVHGISALLVPTSGIVNTEILVTTMKHHAQQQGACFYMQEEVTMITPRNNSFIITTKDNHKYYADIGINCAGVYADTIAKLVNDESSYTIIPARGEFLSFPNHGDVQIQHNIYQTPYGYYKNTGEKANVSVEEYIRLYQQGIITRTVGVHITPLLSSSSPNGEIAVIGPVKTVHIDKQDYWSNRKPKEAYAEKIAHFFPIPSNTTSYYTGIMAIEKNHKDFVIQPDKKFPAFINLIGTDSPGMTSSLAIAEYVEKFFSNE